METLRRQSLAMINRNDFPFRGALSSKRLLVLFAFLATVVTFPNVSVSSGEDMVPEPMSQAQFWSILDSSVSAVGAPDVQIELLKAKLSELKPDDLIAYEVALDAQLKRAYTWDFVAVADILNDGVTDDGFLYFRL